MTKEISAGIIAYFFKEGKFYFLVCHPGGPFFKHINKYGFPKGHQENKESLKETAIREFLEETGIDKIDYRKLKEPILSTSSNKNIYFYLYPTEEIWDLNKLYSNHFIDKLSGKEYPENDKFYYATLEELDHILFKNNLKILPAIKEAIVKYL